MFEIFEFDIWKSYEILISVKKFLIANVLLN
jgi:hypothetical protein